MGAMPLHRETTLSRFYDLLADGHVLTTAEASERLGVTKRQVRRLAHQLRDHDVPLQTRQNGREKAYLLPASERAVPDIPVDLTERQLLALVVAAQTARAKLRPTPLAPHLTDAIGALQAAHPDPALSFEAHTEPARWHFSDAPSVPLDADVFWTLRGAASAQQPVRIDYYSASSDRASMGRKIDPLMIAERRGSWLCVAYCHQRQDVLDFSMAAISSVRRCEGEHFTPPASFDRSSYFAGRFGAVAGETTHTVRLLVESDRAPYFRRKVYHPTQEIAETREDGRIVVRYAVDGLDEIAAWVRSWGAGVKVLAPRALAEQIAAEAKAVRDRYADEDTEEP